MSTMETQPGKSLHEKLLKARGSIKKLEKDGFNSFNQYAYVTDEQIITEVKRVLDENGILFVFTSSITKIMPIKTNKGDNTFLTNVEIEYQFSDENGHITGKVPGQGLDKGDKGVYKAITGALKYCFLKTFLIPTGDDPEKDARPPVQQQPYQQTQRTVGQGTCDQCQRPMKLVPAGVSKKTGNPYDAFYSCKDCNVTKPAGGTSQAGKPVNNAPEKSTSGGEVVNVEENFDDIPF